MKRISLSVIALLCSTSVYGQLPLGSPCTIDQDCNQAASECCAVYYQNVGNFTDMFQVKAYDMVCANSALDGTQFTVQSLDGGMVQMNVNCFGSIAFCEDYNDCVPYQALNNNKYCCSIQTDKSNLLNSKRQCLPSKLDQTSVSVVMPKTIPPTYTTGNAYCQGDLQPCSKNGDCANLGNGEDHCCAEFTTTINGTNPGSTTPIEQKFMYQACAHVANNSKNQMFGALQYTVSCNGLPCKSNSNCTQFKGDGPDLCCASVQFEQWGYNYTDLQCVSATSDGLDFDLNGAKFGVTCTSGSSFLAIGFATLCSLFLLF